MIILHGMYGSGDNWYSIARELAGQFTVYLVDQRNHGNSPHHPEHNYSILADDLYEFMKKRDIKQAILLGHSMGGKAVMQFGLIHPEMVKKMIVVDISPLSYAGENQSEEALTHIHIISSLLNLDIKSIKTREEADRNLSESIPSAMVRQFLLKSLKRRSDGHFEWVINLDALEKNMNAIFDGVIDENTTDPRSVPNFPLLFIKGGRSGYIREHDLKAIHHYFPGAVVSVIPNAGHWIHAEEPKAFLDALRNFLDKENC